MLEHTDLFRPTIRAILFNCSPEILVVKHRSGNWIFPGGGLSAEELKEKTNVMPILESDTLWRELAEEIGLDHDGIRRLKTRPAVAVCSVDWWNDRQHSQCRLDFVRAIYLGPGTRVQCRPNEDEGIIDFCWLNIFHPVFPKSGQWPHNTRVAIKSFKQLLIGQSSPGYFWRDAGIIV